MPGRPEHIAIIGAGIGGLSAAIGLCDAGFGVTVYEQSPIITEIGAGVGVPPNACKVMRQMGLLTELEEIGVADTYGSYRHARTGEELRSTDWTEVPKRFGAPQLRLHRWDMQQVLARGLARRPSGSIRLGHRLENIEPGPDRVRLIFAGGTAAVADVVVAADGIRSTVRNALFGTDAPSFTGFVAWRGLVPVEDVDPNMRIDTSSFDSGLMIRNYLVRRGTLMNVLAMVRSDVWQDEGWRLPGLKQDLLAAFAGFYPAMHRLLAAIPEDALFKWGLFLRPHLDHWVVGRVALLGDAAHPMLPYLGQGGAMAIEDAMILARTLAASEDLEEGLRWYQTTRMDRAYAVAEASAKMGEIFHMDNADDYRPDRDFSAGRLPGLFTYDPVTAPISLA
jgi:salicylate hydroxylase